MSWMKLFKVDLSDKEAIEGWSCDKYTFAIDPSTGMLWTKTN